jgi:hypothetical protein
VLEPRSFNRPVVFFANGFGDHLLVLPTLRALSRIFAGTLSLISLPEAQLEFFSDIDFNSVVPIRFRDLDKNCLVHNAQKVSLLTLDYQWMAAQVYGSDLLISLAQWESESSRSLFKSLAPTVSVGFFPDYTYSLGDAHGHVFDQMFSVPRLFDPNLQIDDFVGPPLIKEKYRLLATDFRRALGTKFKLLTVHSDTKRKKMWLPGNFITVLDRFLEARSNYLAVIVGLWTDLPLEKMRCRDRVFNLTGVPLNLSFALVGVSDLFIGIDSCMLHSADLFKVSGVGIFGPTDPLKWGFRFAKSKHVSARTIEMIGVDEVTEALVSLG